MATVISIENLSKSYQLGQIGTGRLVDDLRVWWARKRGLPNPLSRIGDTEHGNRDGEIIWALKDVSLSVEKGEVLGIIGRNGAGKSTLLKILSRITAPTSGRIKVKGRVSSLLEIGTGFHLELTGRENIYLNGAILGMRRKEIDRKLEEIVDFSGVEQFIDTPVKRYSSGMYVRLAFAVAAHLEPEILLVDEVLAVGDAEFQKKCLGKMSDVAREGRTILFVSHNMAAVQQLCSQAILLSGGKVGMLSDAAGVIRNYLATSTTGISEFRAPSAERAPGRNGVRLLGVRITDTQGGATETIAADASFAIEFDYELDRDIDNLRIGYRLFDANGGVVFTSGDTDPEGHGTARTKGRHVSRCLIPGNLLNGGRYWVTATCDRPMQEVHFLEEHIVSFFVDLVGGVGAAVPDGRLGAIRPSLPWQVE